MTEADDPRHKLHEAARPTPVGGLVLLLEDDALPGHKHEAGAGWEARWFLWTPDLKRPSTWKLRIGELVNGKKTRTRAQLARALSALTTGFRGNAVQGIPPAARQRLVARVRRMVKAEGSGERMTEAHNPCDMNESALASAAALGVPLLERAP